MHQTKTYSLFYPVRDREYLTVFSGEKIARQNNDLNWWVMKPRLYGTFLPSRGPPTFKGDVSALCVDFVVRQKNWDCSPCKICKPQTIYSSGSSTNKHRARVRSYNDPYCSAIVFNISLRYSLLRMPFCLF